MEYYILVKWVKNILEVWGWDRKVNCRMGCMVWYYLYKYLNFINISLMKLCICFVFF